MDRECGGECRSGMLEACTEYEKDIDWGNEP